MTSSMTAAPRGRHHLVVISANDLRGTAPFAWRIFAVNAVLLIVAAVALALSPATVSFPIALTEGIVLAVGLVAILIVNLLLVRRSFAPLERLTRLMRSVDLLRPGQRLDVTGPQEVRELGRCSTRCWNGSSASGTRAAGTR